MTIVISFFGGLFVGGFLGALTMALVIAAAQEDE